jgi:hypothetical protein
MARDLTSEKKSEIAKFGHRLTQSHGATDREDKTNKANQTTNK